MIRSLKRKFILLAMISISLLLAVIVSGMNLINYRSVVYEADEMLVLLSAMPESVPDFLRHPIPKHMSPEAPYEARFFSVRIDELGNPLEVLTERIASVDRETAIKLAAEALSEEKSRGFVGEYRFCLVRENQHSRIIFLDCGRKLHAAEVFLMSSIIMSLVGLGLVFIIMLVFAERIIRPVAESYEKQKRFITDAGHEIKTPLTIISANADLLELDIGENECLADIRQQTKRLGTLTNELVYLARMEEQALPEKLELPISDIVQETVGSFKAIAQSQGKELVTDIEPMLSMKADHKAMEQLISILMDNALKYSPEGENIHIRFRRSGKTLLLSIKNKSTTPLQQEQLKLLFDRFYRADASRNSSTGGYGIGLSIASAITAAHGGKIQARSKKGSELEMLVSLPI